MTLRILVYGHVWTTPRNGSRTCGAQKLAQKWKDTHLFGG